MNSQPALEDLLPCPFCGSKPAILDKPYRGCGATGMEIPDVYVKCNNCGAAQSVMKSSYWTAATGYVNRYDEAKAEAIHTWNTRKPAQPAPLPAGITEKINKYAQACVRWERGEQMNVATERHDLIVAIKEAIQEAKDEN